MAAVAAAREDLLKRGPLAVELSARQPALRAANRGSSLDERDVVDRRRCRGAPGTRAVHRIRRRIAVPHHVRSRRPGGTTRGRVPQRARSTEPSRRADRSDDGGRAGRGVARVERYGPAGPGGLHSRALRGSGGADAGRGGADLPRPADDVSRARSADEPARPPSAHARRHARRARSASSCTDRSRWSRRCWRRSRRAAPTCRSIRPIRRIASPSWSRMPRSASSSREDGLRSRVPAGPSQVIALDARSVGLRQRVSGGARSRHEPVRSRLRDLYLRLHRPPEGRDDRAPQRLELHGRDGRGASTRAAANRRRGSPSPASASTSRCSSCCGRWRAASPSCSIATKSASRSSPSPRRSARSISACSTSPATRASTQQNKYRLLLEGARFADQNGFVAVWTPERHFHAFGGLFPNPAVTSAAIAAITEKIGIRAGSVVSPLHSGAAHRRGMVDRRQPLEWPRRRSRSRRAGSRTTSSCSPTPSRSARS